jgi:hypothetical protein
MLFTFLVKLIDGREIELQILAASDAAAYELLDAELKRVYG